MYQLYFSPGACSMAVNVVLNELGQKPELHKVSLQTGDHKKPEYLKINPRGQVPALVDDGQLIREGAAMMIYLMDKHKSPMLPASGPARAAALEWLCFGNASLHTNYSKAFFVKNNVKDEAVKAELLGVAVGFIKKNWADIETQLGKTKYLAGDFISAADILVTVIANWGAWLPGQTITFGPNTQRLLKEISSRPAYQKALADEGVEYKAVA